MFTTTDYDNLRQIMAESPEKKELLTRLLASHKMEISTISHEIRNPLTLVYSMLQMIETAHPEVSTFKHWSDLHQNIEYMNQLLEELSSYNNGERLNISQIETNSFLKTLVLSFASSLVDTDIVFTSKISPRLPRINGDSIKLRQLLLNLLRNAKDAVSTAPTEKAANSCTQPEITLEAYSDTTTLTIQIKDNGCGIESEQLEHIFEPFITYKKDGTGLGLAISHRVAKAHHGNLVVSSVPGISTVFTLTLPMQ